MEEQPEIVIPRAPVPVAPNQPMRQLFPGAKRRPRAEDASSAAVNNKRGGEL